MQGDELDSMRIQIVLGEGHLGQLCVVIMHVQHSRILVPPARSGWPFDIRQEGATGFPAASRVDERSIDDLLQVHRVPHPPVVVLRHDVIANGADQRGVAATVRKRITKRQVHRCLGLHEEPILP